MIGIYKITSPSKRVYIGQSVNIKKRFNSYKNLHCKGQTIIYNSFLKYGVNNHNFEIICECSVLELNEKERFYQDLYSSQGINGLNCILTRTNNKTGFHSKETKDKISKTLKEKKIKPPSWNGRFHSEETKEKMSLMAKKYIKTDEHRKNISKSMTGKVSPRKGVKCSEETRLKMSISAKLKPKTFGRKVSEETKAKISLALKNRKK